MDISELLKNRIEKYRSEPIEVVVKRDGKEYNKIWADGVKHFVDKINKDREGTQYKKVSFIMVRQKLLALRDLEDLRWFYGKCKQYSTKKGHTFSELFWGSTKIK